MFRVGTILLFISTVLNCLVLVLEELIWIENNYMLMWIHLSLVSSVFVAGTCACIVTALPLGLDQMPDASSSSITSLICSLVYL